MPNNSEAQQLIDKYKLPCMNNEPLECAIIHVEGIISELKEYGVNPTHYTAILNELKDMR